jgi:sugar phosphate isomerase/epimerase
MTTTAPEPKFGVDLITFCHPGFWSVTDREELAGRAAAEPRWFWDRTLKSLEAAGITGVELSFPPGDWDTATSAYGSANGLTSALRSHGLEVTGCYFGALESAEDVMHPSTQEEILEAVSHQAHLVRQCGGDALVVGMPMRVREASGPPQFVDLDYAKAVADLVNRMGAAARREEVRLALHTEMGSVFCLRRDVDLFMLLTDPLYVDFCPDTAHIVLGSSDPVDVLSSHYDRVSITHWKDAAGPVTAAVPQGESPFAFYGRNFRRVGTGVVDWFAWSRRLRDVGFHGWHILELDEAADPVVEITAAREFAETVLNWVHR